MVRAEQILAHHLLRSDLIAVDLDRSDTTAETHRHRQVVELIVGQVDGCETRKATEGGREHTELIVAKIQLDLSVC